jgi:hypothetical protein
MTPFARISPMAPFAPKAFPPVAPSCLTPLEYLQSISLLGNQTLSISDSSPEAMALAWVTNQSNSTLACTESGRFRLRQRYALGTMWFQQPARRPFRQWFEPATSPPTLYWDSSITSNWLNADECSWYGIGCDGAGKVVSIGQNGVMLQKDLVGTLSPELGLLSSLTYMNVVLNRLQGPIPSTLGLWTNLTHFIASVNGLSGSLPSSIGSWTKLTTFMVPVNALTGTIPSAIGNWTALQLGAFSDNNLTGTVPFRAGFCPKTNPSVFFSADCAGPTPEVECPCCDVCCYYCKG